MIRDDWSTYESAYQENFKKEKAQRCQKVEDLEAIGDTKEIK